MFQIQSGPIVVIHNGRHQVTKEPYNTGYMPNYITSDMLQEPTATQLVEILEVIEEEATLNHWESMHC